MFYTSSFNDPFPRLMYADDWLSPRGGTPAVRLTPEEIEARRFRLAPNGYDCEAVDRFLAEVTEALRDQPVTSFERHARSGHPFTR